MLFITRGYSDDKTLHAAERAIAVAEKSGNVRQLLNLLIARGVGALINGNLTLASQLADRAIELANCESSPSALGRVHLLQLDHFSKDAA